MYKFNFKNIFLLFVLISFSSLGDIFADSIDNFKVRNQALLQQKIQASLTKYCIEGCELLSVDIDVSQTQTETDELGFESVAHVDTTPQLQIQKAKIHVQIDDRIVNKEKTRLQKMLENSAQSFTPNVELMWSTVQLPHIGFTDKDEEILKAKVIKDINQTSTKIIEDYCPNDCLLNKITLDAEQITIDEAKSLPATQIFRDANLSSALYVKNILLDFTVDSKMNALEKAKIIDLLRARLSWIEPVEIRARSISFPQNSAAKNIQDPYGLDRLRETLKIFREMSGTKEIITTNTTKDSLNAQNSIQAKEALTLKESRENSLTEKETSEKNYNEKNSSSSSSASDKKMELYLLAGLLVLVIGALVFALTKKSKIQNQESSVSTHNQRLDQALERSGQLGTAYRPEVLQPASQVAIPQISYQEIELKREIQTLKDDMTQFFLRQPKVSKDVFTHILHDQGQEEAAKYVHVFGTFVLREFVNDVSMRQNLIRLSDTYQKAQFDFTDEQTLKILQNLKARMTSSEIRMLVQSDPFKFLKKLDADMLVKLLAGETLLVQGFILTQLDASTRNAVFSRLPQSEKLKIMTELAQVQAIPRDYLESLAQALKDKAERMPELNSEKINGSDILFDLLRQSNIVDQKNLMTELSNSNPQLFVTIKAQLITSDVIPYLREGQILELMMGMNRLHLVNFLLGTTDSIRGSIISRCPRDLVNTWAEDIEARGNKVVTATDFDFASARIHERIQILVQQGGIDLSAINDKIFSVEIATKVQATPLRKAS